MAAARVEQIPLVAPAPPRFPAPSAANPLPNAPKRPHAPPVANRVAARPVDCWTTKPQYALQSVAMKALTDALEPFWYLNMDWTAETFPKQVKPKSAGRQAVSNAKIRHLQYFEAANGTPCLAGYVVSHTKDRYFWCTIYLKEDEDKLEYYCACGAAACSHVASMCYTAALVRHHWDDSTCPKWAKPIGLDGFMPHQLEHIGVTMEWAQRLLEFSDHIGPSTSIRRWSAT